MTKSWTPVPDQGNGMKFGRNELLRGASATKQSPEHRDCFAEFILSTAEGLAMTAWLNLYTRSVLPSDWETCRVTPVSTVTEEGL